MSNSRHRIIKLDVLKAVALLGVVLYQLGITENGYLGLDIFLVVNGFLIGKEISRDAHRSALSYGRFLCKRIIKLALPMLLCIAFSVAAGFMLMLPLDYEALAEDAIASSFFVGNILPLFTGRSCFDSLSRLMPLAHLWFIGLIMQSYFVLPLVPLALRRVRKNRHIISGIIYAALSVLSLVLFLMPDFSEEWRFYLLPFRFFEIGFAAVIACFKDEIAGVIDNLKHKVLIAVEVIIIAALALLMSPVSLPYAAQVLLVCFLSLAYTAVTTSDSYKPGKALRIFGVLGANSYSVFVWMQPVAAFYSYAVSFELGITDALIILAVVAVLAFITSITAVRGINRINLYERNIAILLIIFLIFAGAVSAFSYKAYSSDGVMHNFSELSIDMATVQKNQLEMYKNRAANMDEDFKDSEKVKIAVYGDEAACDFANILIESSFADDIQLSYISSGGDEKYFNARKARLDEADYIFYAVGDISFTEPVAQVAAYAEGDNFYIVGNKYFGISNGVIYNNRSAEDYGDSSVPLPEEYAVQNEALSALYGSRYIDLISPVTIENGAIRVFDNSVRFITEDCHRLTKAGAQFYASKLDLSFIEIPEAPVTDATQEASADTSEKQ